MRRIPMDLQITRSLPNILSLSRILLGVAFFALLPRLETAATAICLGIVLVGAVTDYLDGRIARRTKSVSLLGKWIDPLSDFAFFLFVYASFYRIGVMPLVLLLLFLAREVIMYGVIRTLYMIRKLDPGAKAAGKAKTVLQILGSLLVLFLLLLAQMELLQGDMVARIVPWILLCLVAVSLASLIWYVLPLVRSSRAR
jgi:CDP-diacylglycerol--glycerol-3-phosphate 3-phosphatidyltransferase